MPQKQKRPSPLEDPPTASSSSESEEEHQSLSQVKHVQEEEEEEEASSEEEEASSEEEEEEEDDAKSSNPPQSTSKTTPTPPPTASKPSESESESATESDSNSDTDSDQAPPAPPPNPKVKPIASKPMDQPAKPKAQAQPSSAPPKSATKRSAENNAHAGDPKRAKKKATDAAAAASVSDEEVEDDGKKPGQDPKKMFQRLYSAEDEIAILKGLADFIAKTGNDPLKYGDSFYDFVKKTLKVDANINQLKEKIRRLKKKFQNSASRGKDGEDPKFSKPHDQKMYELGKKVWGSGTAIDAEEKPKSNGKPAKTATAKSPKKEGNSSKNVASAKKPKPETRVEPPPETEVVLALKGSAKVNTDVKAADDDTNLLLSEMFRSANGVSGLNEDVVKRGVELIGASKRAELVGRWKKLQVAELELFAKRAQLIDDQSRLVLEAFKSSNN